MRWPRKNIFGNAIGVTGIVMIADHGTARGGVLVPVAQAWTSLIMLIGVGEGIEDPQLFDARAFSRSLVGLEILRSWLISFCTSPACSAVRGRRARGEVVIIAYLASRDFRPATEVLITAALAIALAAKPTWPSVDFALLPTTTGVLAVVFGGASLRCCAAPTS